MAAPPTPAPAPGRPGRLAAGASQDVGTCMLAAARPPAPERPPFPIDASPHSRRVSLARPHASPLPKPAWPASSQSRLCGCGAVRAAPPLPLLVLPSPSSDLHAPPLSLRPGRPTTNKGRGREDKRKSKEEAEKAEEQVKKKKSLFSPARSRRARLRLIRRPPLAIQVRTNHGLCNAWP